MHVHDIEFLSSAEFFILKKLLENILNCKLSVVITYIEQ